MEIVLVIMAVLWFISIMALQMKFNKHLKRIVEDNKPTDYDALYIDLGGDSPDPYKRYQASVKVIRTIKALGYNERTALGIYEAEAMKNLSAVKATENRLKNLTGLQLTDVRS